MKLLIPLALLVLSGCAIQTEKTMFIDGLVSRENAAVVAPTKEVHMLIRSVNGRSTFTASVGYLGDVLLPPGDHIVQVELGHDVGHKSAVEMGRSPPAGAVAVPLHSTEFKGLLVGEFSRADVPVAAESGKAYVIRYGVEVSGSGEAKGVAWAEESSPAM